MSKCGGLHEPAQAGCMPGHAGFSHKLLRIQGRELLHPEGCRAMVSKEVST